MKYLALFLLSVAYSVSCAKEQVSKPTQSEARAKTTSYIPESLSKLNGAANLLMVVSDSGLNTPCNVTPEQAMRWLNPLHSVIDEQVEFEAKAALKSPKTFWTSRKLDTCEKRCECAQYASVLEAAPKAFPQKKLQALQRKAAAQTPETLKECAQKEADWFCASDLRNKLENESKGN